MTRTALLLVSTLVLAANAARAAGTGDSAGTAPKAPDLSRSELEKVQEFRYDQDKMPGLLVPDMVHVREDHVYVSGCFPVKISVFSRDPGTELLKYAGIWDHEPHYRAINKQEQHAFAHMANGRDGVVYVVGHHFHVGNHSFGLHWYRIDEKTGAATHLGSMKTPKSSGGSDAWGEVACTRDGRNLYLFDAGTHTIHWYRPDETGKPVLAGQVSGKGLITGIKFLGGARGPWAMTADEKFIYSVDANQGALGWVRLGEDGKPEYGGSLDLVEPLGLDPKTYSQDTWVGFTTSRIIASSDGRHLYLPYTNKSEFGAAVFGRDARSGAVSFLRKLDLGKTGRQGNMVLAPDGRGGFFVTGTAGGTLGYFSRNAETGDLEVEKTVALKSALHPTVYVGYLAISSSGRACYLADHGRHKSGAVHVYKLVEKDK